MSMPGRAAPLLLSWFVLLPAVARGGATWSAGAGASGTGVVAPDGASPVDELGLRLSAHRSLRDGVSLGLECAWWEELGRRSFAYETDGPPGPYTEHDRDVAAGLVLRLHRPAGPLRTSLSIGVGAYVGARRLGYADHAAWTSPATTPGFSLGIGAEGTRPVAPAFELRWHRCGEAPHRIGPGSGRDRLEACAGVRFESSR